MPFNVLYEMWSDFTNDDAMTFVNDLPFVLYNAMSVAFKCCRQLYVTADAQCSFIGYISRLYSFVTRNFYFMAYPLHVKRDSRLGIKVSFNTIRFILAEVLHLMNVCMKTVTYWREISICCYHNYWALSFLFADLLDIRKYNFPMTLQKPRNKIIDEVDVFIFWQRNIECGSNKRR